MPTIYFTVTTDLTYDQRMIRICTSLSNVGYKVFLVGRKSNTSIPIVQMPFQQIRLFVFFKKGSFFYVEYNLRLFFFLLFRKMDCICAIDLDTILPCLYISRFKQIRRVYDAHELFCEMKEVVTRPKIYKLWKFIEKHTVPHFKFGYTVNKPIAEEFKKMYNSDYDIIRNISNYSPAFQIKENYILYQGAVNEGRSFETLIPAMKFVDGVLIICGDGNFMKMAKLLVEENALQDKIIFRGMITPSELKKITSSAYIGITLFENTGKSNYFSLANRFFDYIQAGVPQLCVDYPVYREINDKYNIAVLIEDLQPANIARQLNELLANKLMWHELHANCARTAKILNWENEEIKLINFYSTLFA